MMRSRDTPPGIAPGLQWRPSEHYPHVVAGMHIGKMTMNLNPTRFASILTVAEQPGVVPDGVAHRHLHLSYMDMDPAVLDEAVTWVLAQTASERCVLVRSEGGKQRPALVVAIAILRMGGFEKDALYCVRRAQFDALSDFRYLAMVKAADRKINGRLLPKPQP